jgi:exopolysaccharide biosynthesis polyprenyl glycosylphosphotransferase
MIPRRILWLIDAIVIILAFLMAFFLAPLVQWGLATSGLLTWPLLLSLSLPMVGWLGQTPLITDLLWILFVMIPTTIVTMELLRGDQDVVLRSRTRILVTSLVAPVIGLSLITLALFALKNPGWSRLFVFLFSALSGLGLAAMQTGLQQYFRMRKAAGFYAKNVVFIGTESAVAWMERYFQNYVSPGEYRVLGYLSLPVTESVASGTPSAGPGPSLAKIGSASELGDRLIHCPIQQVIAIQPQAGEGYLQQVVRDCDYFRVALSIIPEALLLSDLSDLMIIHPPNALELPAVVLAPKHWDSEALFMKRLLDIFVAGFALVVLSPVFAAIAIAIKITTPRLPVLYPWRVVGRNGVEFTGYKFTTMVADADDRKAELESQNEMSGPVFKIKNDPRTTALGRFLRKFSLNELPQLWSVLKGEMSMVGPRPAFRHELERYEMWHKRKLSIRPGITCLWQVRGRNRVSNFDEWVKMDLEYIDHWSLWLDIKILARTVWVVFAGTGS